MSDIFVTFLVAVLAIQPAPIFLIDAMVTVKVLTAHVTKLKKTWLMKLPRALPRAANARG
jgi:hypothetical protein